MIVQHLALGHGVGVIDPHGDLAEELLNHIPPSRADHLYNTIAALLDCENTTLLGSIACSQMTPIARGSCGRSKTPSSGNFGPRNL